MLNLSLIRHAKSDWENFDGDDMSRSISVTGIRKTEKISNFLREKEMTFDERFCSPSRRTKETCCGITRSSRDWKTFTSFFLETDLLSDL